MFTFRIKFYLLIATSMMIVSCRQSLSPRIVETDIIVVLPTPQTANNDMSRWLTPYKSYLDKTMNVSIGFTKQTLKSDMPESLLGNMITDAMGLYAKSKDIDYDCIIYNIGGIRDSVRQGDITIGDIYRVIPFENKLVMLTLSANDIDSLCQIIALQGGQATSGFSMIIENSKATNTKIAGMPILQNRTYRVLTNDYLSFGNDFLYPLANYTDIHSFDITIREILIDYIKQHTANKISLCPTLKNEVIVAIKQRN